MATIYLIRHGQASFGAENYDKLSQLGERQAEIVGQYFRQCDIRLDAAYSGNLSRQHRTAELTIEQQGYEVPHHIDARFNEVKNDEHVEYFKDRIAARDPDLAQKLVEGSFTSKDYQKVVEAVFTHWVSPDCNEPRTQSWADYSAEVKDAMRDVMKHEGSGKTIGIFTSGGTIATIVSQVLGLTGEHAYSFYEPVINCSVTQLFYNSSRVSLSYFNDHSFLDILGRQNSENLVTYR
ncbi:histidine phosphatase family protein [Parvularcula sp. IMCC14364]|uniref:histidine phosphatase family protein n=1 Tax=Parvularcula sp. IMCC14364 TaxID=3067902 RepID=UPI0027403454|nr:histidine phosphatase family protein [Parvularcula sp. IMCC14364]